MSLITHNITIDGPSKLFTIRIDDEMDEINEIDDKITEINMTRLQKYDFVKFDQLNFYYPQSSKSTLFNIYMLCKTYGVYSTNIILDKSLVFDKIYFDGDFNKNRGGY